MLKAAVLFLYCFLSLTAFAQTKPNIVFILADDMGYGDPGCYGQRLIETPHIDQLAAGGIRFTQFYAGTSVCAPSRSSLLTGQHTGHTPVRGNYEIQPEGQLPLPDTAYTMAEMLKNAGYVTGNFGKWGLGYPGSEGAPNQQGFDRFFGYNCQRQSHNYFPGHLWNNNTRIDYANTPASQQYYAPDLIQKEALAFIDEYKTKPFFLYLSYTLPHAALQLPQNDSLLDYYKRKFNEQPQVIPASWDGKGYQPQAYPHAAYAAMVTRLDHYVGQVVEKLKTLGLEKNTLIIFTSDNGPHREGGNDPAFFNSSGGFRGIKRDLYEGGIRTPVIAYWPAVITKPKVSGFTGAFWDFMPTFAAIAGAPVPPHTDGVSLLPTLSSKGKQKQHPFLYWEFHEDGGRQAVRMGEWKGVRLNVMKDPGSPLELYNLDSDRGETKNVAMENPRIVQSIQQIMQNEHTENIHFPFLKN
ncbi:arylsulfatase [Agriterribacter sp.]|uniref:arylsulfatase n=1 Tax=Agriterribacter sp. TaxID=2821509 RepID=UPI002C12B10E|nr:arylsulfatase [Agriterribacter sp.]HRO45696.1 arylsulfatase [Agriterribacter sp.]HRQ15826.1 arylsulfatase [Agriterribacter sp.]